MNEEEKTIAVASKKLYSWSEFDVDCFFLSTEIEKLKSHGLVDALYGLPRGGLVVAVRLSHLTGLPMVYNLGDINARTIVVDDILDSGMTLNTMMVLASRMKHVAVLHWNDKTVIPQQMISFLWAKKKAEWIVYPWETYSSSKYDGTI
jgi:hypoxanthine phosphoribosyltransferase